MNRDDILRIKASWKKLEPHVGQFTEQFYARLFELDPWLEKPFGADWRTGGEDMLGALGVMVNDLEDSVVRKEIIRSYAAHAAGWGLREDDLYLVGLALFAALEAGLGSAFTTSVRHAWGLAYGELAQEFFLVLKTAA